MRIVTSITSYRTELHNIINISTMSWKAVFSKLNFEKPENIDKIVNRI